MVFLGYLLVALAGLFAANGIPHFTRGIAGWQHRVPWRKPGSAAENVVWGAINFLAATWLGWWGSTFGLFLPLAVTVAIVVGAAGGALLGSRWEKDPQARGA